MSVESERRTPIEVRTDVEPWLRPWTREEYDRLVEHGFFEGQKVERRDRRIVQWFADRGPTLRRWTRDEYYRLAELGFFERQRVERIDGEIWQYMSPQGARHAATISRTIDAVRRVFGAGCVVRSQMPLELGLTSDPEPDVAVVTGTLEEHELAHPTTALLVVEVADSSLAADRRLKASLYAAGGILDYWLVDLVARRVEVRREPVADAGEPLGFRYTSVSILEAGDSLAPLAAPLAPIAASEILPRAS